MGLWKGSKIGAKQSTPRTAGGKTASLCSWVERGLLTLHYLIHHEAEPDVYLCEDDCLDYSLLLWAACVTQELGCTFR